MDGCAGQDPAYRATYAKAPLKRGAFASLRVYDQRRTAESRVEVNVSSATEEGGMAQRRVVIMGAAGRDFHDFNMLYRGKEAESRVVAFTATQIPRIDSRLYPTELAGAAYPEGIPIYPEEKLEEIIRNEGVDEVIFAYSDVSHEHVMHQASRALAAGANFRLHGPRFTSIPAAVPVISVCAVRTGAGKSQTSRYITDVLLEEGVRPVVIRHPMPYGDLLRQRVQRFQTMEDLAAAQTTVEEREDYEPHLRRGITVYAGVDYEAVVEKASADGDVIVWDGGNNDFSFVESDLEIVVVDPFRPEHGLTYHPGEVNLRRADVVVVNKVGSAPQEGVDAVMQAVREVNPNARCIKVSSSLRVEDETLMHISEPTRRTPISYAVFCLKKKKKKKQNSQ